MLHCKFIEHDTSQEGMEKFSWWMAHELMPILKEGWDKHDIQVYGKELSVDVKGLLWLYGQKVIHAYVVLDGDEIVGYLLAIKWRPTFYDVQALTVEKFYARTQAAEAKLAEFFKNSLQWLGVQDIYMIAGAGVTHPDLGLTPVSNFNYKLYRR